MTENVQGTKSARGLNDMITNEPMTFKVDQFPRQQQTRDITDWLSSALIFSLAPSSLVKAGVCCLELSTLFDHMWTYQKKFHQVDLPKHKRRILTTIERRTLAKATTKLHRKPGNLLDYQVHHLLSM